MAPSHRHGSSSQYPTAQAPDHTYIANLQSQIAVLASHVNELQKKVVSQTQEIDNVVMRSESRRMRIQGLKILLELRQNQNRELEGALGSIEFDPDCTQSDDESYRHSGKRDKAILAKAHIKRFEAAFDADEIRAEEEKSNDE